MKDWKAEYEKLQKEIERLQKEVEYWKTAFYKGLRS